jgi:hypothetical protein
MSRNWKSNSISFKWPRPRNEYNRKLAVHRLGILIKWFKILRRYEFNAANLQLKFFFLEIQAVN